MVRFVFLLVVLIHFFAFGNTLRLPDSLMNLSNKVSEQTMSLQYKEAIQTAKKLRSLNESAGCVIESIVRISIYDDKGDTLSLFKAGEILESCKSEGLWDALRKFEIGYVQSETGHSLKGALQTRSAAKEFENSKELEPRAFYAIYAYYIDKSFSWVPFKSDNREEYLAILDSASKKSLRFWPLFLTSLIWMYYDKEDYLKGLKLAEYALKRSPNHPVMLQIKADMLYRLKKYSEASSIYETSAKDYLKRTGESIRYWCSILNLIRIYNDAGNTAKVQKYKAKLESPKFKALKNWMPGSLIDDLKSKELL